MFRFTTPRSISTSNWKLTYTPSTFIESDTNASIFSLENTTPPVPLPLRPRS